ncbi:hypothetical protein BX666DRAFT_916944 [Dichotomocladium elegans]|nr:hypothetical protein BX666DRAFT_916944 [Dichotomocladium elegans]
MPSILNFNTNLLLRSRRVPMLDSSLPFVQSPTEVQDTHLICNEALFQSTLNRLDHPDESLWALGKALKAQEDEEGEYYHSTEACFRRAIRIIIYHAKGAACHPKYYRKCTEIEAPVSCGCCPPHIVSALREIQTSAEHIYSSMQRSPSSVSMTSIPSTRSSSSCSSSSSSSRSSTRSNCSHCGKEKRGMPVCAKCKAQAYCSLRCLHAHSLEHNKTCAA